MRYGAVVLAVSAMVLVPTAENDRTVQLGDYGRLVYADGYQPDHERLDSLLRLVFAQFDDGELPEIEVRLNPLDRVETALAQHEAGPVWRQWLVQFRKTRQIIFGFIETPAARRGKLIIHTWQLSDRVIVHECLHFLFEHKLRFMNTERGVLASELLFVTSDAYKDWLRERPWLND